ncbi:MAG: hypothetical protein LBV12_11115 [Puniceicoccales bacterium]|jgi:hypothetical protein|nr:hypothetical protein [Puniceicoccales bacterium]
MALKKAAGNTEKEGPRVNPEIDARLNQFIKDNPKLYEYYCEMSKEQLVRKQMLSKMNQSDYAQRQNEEVKNWLEQNPEISARVEERVARLSPERQERARVTIAKDEMVKQAMRQPAGVKV